MKDALVLSMIAGLAGASSVLAAVSNGPPAACPLSRVTLALPAPAPGVVVAFVSKQKAATLIMHTESLAHAQIDPDYVDNQRVVLRLSSGRRAVVLVPHDMTVTIGEAVTFTPGHASRGDKCLYVPNLIDEGLNIS
jgi:hypothetical protein